MEAALRRGWLVTARQKVEAVVPDLTGAFRVDMKTILLLLSLAFSWWDTRREVKDLTTALQAEQETAAKEEAARKQEREKDRASLDASLRTFSGDLKVLGYDIRDIQLAMARAGIDLPKREEKEE